MGDLFRDRLDNPYEAATLLHGKTRELLRLLSVRNIPTEQIAEFLTTFIRENRFRQVEFDEMNREFVEKFGVDWMDVLPQWYENRKIPVFLCQRFLRWKILPLKRMKVTAFLLLRPRGIS